MNDIASNNTLKRPIIGVLVSNLHIRKLKKQHPKFEKSFRYIRFIGLVKANQEAKTTLYFFSTRNIDMNTLQIHGTYFNENTGYWERKFFPLPDVLFVRIGGKKRRVIIKQLIKMGTKKLNPRHSFDKWYVYRKLKKYKKVRPYLPLTIAYNTPNDLEMMFIKSKSLYLKPRKGNCGKKVLRVKQLSNGTYLLNYSVRRKGFTKQIDNFDSLVTFIQEFFAREKFIIQQAIPLLTKNSRLVDMRAEVQRNGMGEIDVAAISVRIGQRGSHITSVKSERSVYPIEEFLSKYLHYSKAEINILKSRIQEFLLNVYHGMEKSYGTFGEIGIDFGMDKDGKLWLIECNARSGKAHVKETKNEKAILKAFLNPLEYAKFINKQKKIS